MFGRTIFFGTNLHESHTGLGKKEILKNLKKSFPLNNYFYKPKTGQDAQRMKDYLKVRLA